MTIHKLSLMDAYLIETLRSNGISNKEIITQVKADDVAPWQELHEHFDFNELVKLANKDIEQFEGILSDGYKIKFVTFNGLKNLLRIRFGKEQDKDYDLQEKGIRNLVLNQEELRSVKQMLSINWVLEEVKEENASVVSIELV